MATTYQIKNIGGQMYYVPENNNTIQTQNTVPPNLSSSSSIGGGKSVVPKGAIPVNNSNSNGVSNGTGAVVNKYTPNVHLASQLSQLSNQLSPTMIDAYNAKMAGYGITPNPLVRPANIPQQGEQVFQTMTQNNDVPVKGGK